MPTVARILSGTHRRTSTRAASDAILATGRDGVIEFWNPVLSGYSDFPPNRLWAARSTSSFPKFARPSLAGLGACGRDWSKQIWRGRIAVRSGVDRGRASHLRRRVHDRHAEDDGSGTTGVAAILRDVTARFEEIRSLPPSTRRTHEYPVLLLCRL